MAEGTADSLDSACFPLVPYCNRITGGAFAWLGDKVQLPHNFPACESVAFVAIGAKNQLFYRGLCGELQRRHRVAFVSLPPRATDAFAA